MATNHSILNRRTIVAGLAAAPIAGLPAIAGAVGADPLLEVLAEYERLHAIEQAAWEAAAAAEPVGKMLSDVVFNGKSIFSIANLEIMRECSMGMTDEQLDEAIARIRTGNARMRAEAIDLEPEYQKARAELEARGGFAQEASPSEALDAESAAQEALDNAKEAQMAVFEAVPTTRAGAARLLKFIADFLDEDDVINDTRAEGKVGDAIRNAVAVLEREARS